MDKAYAHAGCADGVGDVLPPPCVLPAMASLAPPQAGTPTVITVPATPLTSLWSWGGAWWTQLTEEGSWMVQVVDDAGEVLAISIPTTRSRP